LLGFDFVDLGMFARSPQLSPESFISDGPTFTRSLKEDLSEIGLGVSDVFLQIGAHPGENATNDPSAAVRRANRDVFMRTLDLSAELNCTHLTGLPGVWHEDRDARRDRALAAKEAVWRTEMARKAGVRYAFEPHIGSLCDDLQARRIYSTKYPASR